MDLGRRKKPWPKLAPPRDRAAVTVADVMKADPGQPRDEAIKKWAAAVWDSWHEQRDWTRQTWLFHSSPNPR